MPPFTDLEGQSDHLVVLKIVNMSLVVLDLYKCCVNLVSHFNRPCYFSTCF